MKKFAKIAFLSLLIPLATRAEILITPGSSVTVQGETISCKSDAPIHTGSSGGIIRSIVCGNRVTSPIVYSFDIRFTSGTNTEGMGTNGSWLFDQSMCAKIASKFNSAYSGPFEKSKTYRFCEQQGQIRCNTGGCQLTPDASKPFSLYECLVSARDEKTICSRKSIHSNIDECVSSM